jgi:hypothetical protein
MKWDAERRQLVSKLSSDGLSPAAIAARFGVSEGALRGAMYRYGIREHLRGMCVFATARGRVRKQVKPRRAAKVSLAPIRTE